MAIAFVQAWTATEVHPGTSVTTGSLTTTSGNFIGVAQASSTNTGTMSDSKSNLWKVAIGPSNNGVDYVAIRYSENIIGGASHTLSFSTGGSAFYHTLCAAEYSGLALSSSLDKTASGTGNSTSLLTSATATTTAADELILGAGNLDAFDAQSWTAGTNFNIRSSMAQGNVGVVGFLEDRIVSSTGAYTASATWNGTAAAWICLVATFRAPPAASSPSGAAVRFITATTISGTYDDTVRSYDATSLIPSGMSASGVLLRYRWGGNTSSNFGGFYHGDSTDSYTWANTATGSSPTTWNYAACGLNAANNFKYRLQSGAFSPTVQVVGFFDSANVRFLTNAVISTPGTNVYTDISIATSSGATTATGAIFHAVSQRSGGSVKFAWRENGASEDLFGAVGRLAAFNGCGLVIVKVDASEICEWKMDNANGGASAYLVGYIVSGVTYYGAVDKSTGTTGSYQAVTSLSGVGAYVEMVDTGNANGSQGVTKNSGTDDTYASGPSYNPSLIEISSGQIEQKIAATTQDLYLRATIDAAAASGPPAGSLALLGCGR